MATITRVNERGIGYLKAWILATTKRDEEGNPYCNTDQRAIEAWCQEIEGGADAGMPHAEMAGTMTASGNPEVFTMPADGLSVDEIDD